RTQRISEVIEMTGLTKERHKVIRSLSKGYRQRVGLAQAMLHDPGVLVLDEATSGLDPNQLVEIGQLIRNLGKEKTILMSTHIMHAIPAACDRVVIIYQDQVLADDKIEPLRDYVINTWRVSVTRSWIVFDDTFRESKGYILHDSAG